MHCNYTKWNCVWLVLHMWRSDIPVIGKVQVDQVSNSVLDQWLKSSKWCVAAAGRRRKDSVRRGASAYRGLRRQARSAPLPPLPQLSKHVLQGNEGGEPSRACPLPIPPSLPPW